MLRLTQVVDELAAYYSEPATQEENPWRAIVAENIAYLVDDAQRAQALDRLEQAVGLAPQAIVDANPSAIRAAAELGGAVNVDGRVEKVRLCAEIVLKQCTGDLAGAIAEWPLPRVRKLLKAFPGIGEPGVARLLLFSGREAAPALESNAVRVLTRLGFLSEDEQYAAWYKNAIAVMAKQGRPQGPWLRRAFLLLRAHGRELCKRKEPLCDPCPLKAECRFYKVRAAAEAPVPSAARSGKSEKREKHEREGRRTS